MEGRWLLDKNVVNSHLRSSWNFTISLVSQPLFVAQKYRNLRINHHHTITGVSALITN
jgi:hypothetical protein